MITVRNLDKRFGRVRAVRDLSFDVRPGVVTGFLGPNGAGKSTTLRLMLDLDRGDGETLFDGRRFAQHERPLRRVGTVLDATAFHPTRSARNHLRMLAASARIADPRVDEVIATVGLTEVADGRPGEFSLGMGQRLALAAALLGDPAYLILDEPANGLDPQGIQWLRQLLRHLAAQGRAVLVSSHQLAEMAQMADELVVIGRGLLIADGPMQEFVSRFTQRHVLVRSPQAGLLAVLLREAQVGPVTTASDGSLLVADTELSVVGEIAGSHQITLHELSEQAASLEQAFLEATGEATDYRAGSDRPGADATSAPTRPRRRRG
ncbi:MAG TPA: ATP-binding cassette domain-containing protein [Kineosporiaceae bacterium]|nr:ATP-binding cassette domain-containing protein [Kineosporiaceae bacterium]